MIGLTGSPRGDSVYTKMLMVEAFLLVYNLQTFLSDTYCSENALLVHPVDGSPGRDGNQTTGMGQGT